MSKVTDLVDGNFEAFRQGITADLYTKLSERLNLERQEISQGLYKDEIDEGKIGDAVDKVTNAAGTVAGKIVGTVQRAKENVKNSFNKAKSDSAQGVIKPKSQQKFDHTPTDHDYELNL